LFAGAAVVVSGVPKVWLGVAST